MDSKPRGFDAFCGAGGVTRGYQLAGAYMVGCDIKAQPRYVGEEFVQGDALELLADVAFMAQFAFVHASPPCQFYAGLSRGKHWRSIPPVRELLEKTGLPYVIENIADAAWDMREPVRLCGSMFGLHVRRHRLFETTMPFFMQPDCNHAGQGEIRAYYGKPGWATWTPGAAVVNGGERKPLLRGSVKQASADMGIDWMDWDELREAIPPAYTELIGHQLMSHLKAVAA